MKRIAVFVAMNLVLFAFIKSYQAYAFGQEDKKPQLFHPFWGKDMGCENNINKVEFLKNYASYESKFSRVIILIIRPGVSEHDIQRLNSRRAYNLRRAMKEHSNVIVTLADSSLSIAKVDVYINGKLEDEMMIERNKDFCLSCCEGDSGYYPDIDRKKGRR